MAANNKNLKYHEDTKEKLNVKEAIKKVLMVGDYVYIAPSAYGDKNKISRAKILNIGENILEIQYTITGEYNAIPYIYLRRLQTERAIIINRDSK